MMKHPVALNSTGAKGEQKMSPTIITSLFGSILRVGRTFTPPMGTPKEIAELQPVELNGYPQWLLIRGQDVSRPLLLFLHGGPGASNMWLAHSTMNELEQYFVCVNWDQRGTGKSFRPGPPAESMTIDQFVNDTIALMERLGSRFGQQKVLLLGHSWGSVLAMKVAAARPDLLYAVIGMGQVVDGKRGEDLSYRYVLERAHAEHNRKAIRILEQLGGADTYRKDGKFVQRRWLVRYGGMMHAPDTGAVVSILLNAPECSIMDCLSPFTMRDMKFSCRRMGDEIMGANLLQEISELCVPVFFFTGRYDYTTPFVLVEQFYARLSAPYKKLIWFEHSAHMPHMEEPDKFQRELIAIGDEFCCEKQPQEARHSLASPRSCVMAL
jgi:pimeloyl-ACP methyl ester carboxylesterase